jgi:hypothetical protein
MAGNQHDQTRREHTEEPNTGMRVGGDGNKIHGDDLEEMIPGRGKDRVRRGAETFDIEGERVTRTGNRRDKLADEDSAYEDDDKYVERGVETFDIAGNDGAPGEDADTDYKGT